MTHTNEFRFFEARPGVAVILLPEPDSYTIVAASDDFIATSGFAKEAVIGKNHFEIFPENPYDPQSFGERSLRHSFEYILRHKKPHSLPLVRYDIPDGNGSFSEKYWRASNVPVLSENGEVAYIIHTAEDVTALVKAEHTEEAHQQLLKAYKKIEESEQKYRRLFEAIDQGFGLMELIYDEHGRPVDHLIVEANSLFETQTGLMDAIGKTAREVAPGIESRWFELYDDVIRSGKPARFVEESKALGRWFDVFVYPAGDTESKRVAVLFADITARKQAEQALLASEEQFRLMADTIPQSIWITDATGRTEFLNKHWCEYSGEPYSPTTAADIAVKYLHPEDAPKVMQAFKEAMEKREPFEVEQRNRSKEGEYRWFLNRAQPYKDPQTGTVVKWFGLGIDIHDRKLAEQALRRSEEALEKKVQDRTLELENANRELKRSNVNLEEFAYAASHDMKEPIRKIHFFSDRLKSRLGDKLAEEDLRYFSRMEAAVQRMSTLIDDLLTYSHISKGISHQEMVDLNDTLQMVMDDMELIFEEKKAEITIDSLPAVKGHRRQLQQLFGNLIGNALKYSKRDITPVVRITSRLLKGSDTPLSLPAEDTNKQFHFIEIKDNGIGFDQADAERIFNVFTRLHGMAEYKGTGVGLSIVRKVVENHQGYVWAESKAGAGASFRVLLPAN